MTTAAKRKADRKLADALEEIRLTRRWSYRELGEEVGRALHTDTIPDSTVRLFIQQAGNRNFYDTTVYPFRKYVESQTATAEATR